MRFEDIELEELSLNGDRSGDFIIPATDELVEIMNNIRKEKGYTDLVGADYDNDVYYNYYLIFYPIKERTIRLISCVNNAKEDDWVNYELEVTPEEKELLAYKIIETLVRIIEEGD